MGHHVGMSFCHGENWTQAELFLSLYEPEDRNVLVLPGFGQDPSSSFLNELQLPYKMWTKNHGSSFGGWGYCSGMWRSLPPSSGHSLPLHLNSSTFPSHQLQRITSFKHACFVFHVNIFELSFRCKHGVGRIIICVHACFVARSRRSLRGDRWTTGWSLWLWPTTGTLTCRRPPGENAHLLCRPCSGAARRRAEATVSTETSQLTLWAHVYSAALMFLSQEPSQTDLLLEVCLCLFFSMCCHWLLSDHRV